MFTDPNTDKERSLNAGSTGQEQPADLPAEITNPLTETNTRAGEVIGKTGELMLLRNEQLPRLIQDQFLAQQSFENGVIPSQLPMHNKVQEMFNKVQIDQLKKIQNIINAEEKAKLTEIKAGNLDAVEKVSEFNRNRLLEYSKTGAKAIGFTAKYLAMGGLWVTKIGLLAAKETFKAAADIWYSLWGAHRDYREKYPNQDQI
ncbi:hypothetical protein C0416_00220 [bacterium]|nr:hypothetical protein [bacterium]